MSAVNDMAAQPAAATPPRADDMHNGTATGPAIRVALTLEVLVYVALVALALVLRGAQLERFPLDDAEARQALAALRTVSPSASGTTIHADSPLTFAFQAVAFAFNPGASATAARLPVVLGGVLLVLAPALWRRYLDPLPPLIMAALLAISPTALLASRTTSPVIWTMLLALVLPWLALRYAETRQRVWAVAATAAGAAMVLLAEPAGFLALFSLGFGIVFAVLTDVDDETDSAPALRGVLRGWPWRDGLIAGAGLVLAVSTLVYFVPSGLSTTGNLVSEAVRGFVRRGIGVPVAFPLWVALRYETGLVLLGAIASYRAIREGGFFERAVVGWLLAGLVWSVGYAGAGAAHALWITLPLVVLVALAVTHWLTERALALWDVPGWAIPAHAVVTFALWCAVGLSVVLLGKRLLIDLPGGVTELSRLLDALLDGVYSRNVNNPQTVYVQNQPVWDYVLGYMQLRVLITVLVTLLNGVLYFLVGSLWGARVAWRGFALGTLAFVLMFGFSLGGRAAFGTSGDPREYWHADPVTGDLYELRATLHEMSLRDTGEPNLIAVTAWLADDGAAAWALRDFPNARFVSGVGPEVTSAAVVMPDVVPRITMGADYIGKDLITRLRWDADSLSWRDAIMWYYNSDSHVDPAPVERLMVWVRKDVYGVEQVTEQ